MCIPRYEGVDQAARSTDPASDLATRPSDPFELSESR